MIKRQVFWLGKGSKILNCLISCSFFQLCEFMSFYGEDILIRRKVSFPASIISGDNAWIIIFAPKSVNLDTEILVTVCLNGRTKQSSGYKSLKTKLDSFNFPTLKSSPSPQKPIVLALFLVEQAAKIAKNKDLPKLGNSLLLETAFERRSS